MQITALGHSCLLLDLHSEGQHTRILVDPWLSDHATGDGMGRFPRLRFDAPALGDIDAVFISHAHSDHLDPYTLVRLWRELPKPPMLLLPVSLAFLVPVLSEHLAPLHLELLVPQQPVVVGGLEVLGLFDIGLEPTNEEDVMVLVLRSGTERVLVEADARLSLEVPELRAFISSLLCEPGVDSAVFLTTENELTGTLEGRTCDSVEAREALAERVMDELLDEVHELYHPCWDPEDLFHGAHVLRLVHGQGLTAPHELDPDWQHILFPLRIADRIREERAAAARSGFAHHIDGLTVGSVHTIVAGRITQRAPLSGLTLLDAEADRDFDVALGFFPELPLAPVRPTRRDEARQRDRIQALLEQRLLPYLHGLRMPPVLQLLAVRGAYRVRVHFGLSGERFVDYVLGYAARGFVSDERGEEEPDESYWANDLEDFLDGHIDEFSPFCRTQLPSGPMRLWACLATPLLNSDLVEARVRLHFERARQGLTPGSFVLVRYASARS